MNEKSSVIHLYCTGLHFICFTVGLPLVYMTMLINCEGPICRCWRVPHMWLQTANHAGGSVPAQHTTACNTTQSERAAVSLFYSNLEEQHVNGVREAARRLARSGSSSL